VISCHIDKNIATLQLSKPSVGNALGADFWKEFPLAIEQLQRDPEVHAVVITGEGKHFCVGIDLKFAQQVFVGPTDEAGRRQRIQEIEAMQDAFQALEKLDVPVIAAIHGACIGAGVELASSADIRLCTQDAVFSVKEIQLGIIPDLGGLQRLPRQLPQGVARELAFTGRNFSAKEALQWHWVNNSFSSEEELYQAAYSMAGQIASYAPRAMQHIKRSLADATINTDHSDMRALIEPQVDECISVDMIEAMQAAQEKRPAKFPKRTIK